MEDPVFISVSKHDLEFVKRLLHAYHTEYAVEAAAGVVYEEFKDASSGESLYRPKQPFFDVVNDTKPEEFRDWVNTLHPNNV